MNATATANPVSALSPLFVPQPSQYGNSAQTAVIATRDAGIRKALSEILDRCGIRAEFACGFAALADLFAAKGPAVCLCGFALEDGTYRDVVKFCKRRSPEVPVIIASTSDSANEYDEYLASMNAGAFDFLCYPYEKREVQRILRLAMQESRGIAP